MISKQENHKKDWEVLENKNIKRVEEKLSTEKQTEKKYLQLGVPVVAQWKRIWLGTMRLQVQSLASFSGLKDLALPWAVV